jgi:NAD(P)-dependent dehydrogenase (short-subunit alcohol dehydrogenase family)
MKNQVVVIASDQNESAVKMAECFEKAGAKVILITGTNDREAMQEVVDRIENECHRIDVLIHDYDHYTAGEITEENDWRLAFERNVIPLYELTQEIVKVMKKAKYGRIITLSQRSWLGGKEEVAYSMAMGSMISFTRSLALELAQDNITVNGIVKGMMEQDQVKRREEEGMVAVQPIPSKGSLEDIAHALLFFSDKENHYVTGQTLYVCGGLSLYSSLSL